MNMNTAGFTLFELLIVLVIIGILTTVSYPVYRHAMKKARRSEAKIALIKLAQHMEIYYLSNNHSYEQANFSKLHLEKLTEKKFYRLALKSTADTYQVSAKAQFSDPECFLFMLNHLGEKTNAGSDSNLCW